MQFSKHDIQQLENIMRALRGGTFSFTGLEVLAFGDSMRWASRLHASISQQIELEEKKQSFDIQGSPFKESPIQSIEPTKASTSIKRKK